MSVREEKKELIKYYNGLKKEYENDLNSETLRKYNILSSAFKLGRKIYGRSFNTQRLSDDFEVPYTTVKRILSLNKANTRTWDKIKSGKITSFKAAQVLMQKNTNFQDSLIDLVIEKNLSTYQIKCLKDGSLEEIKQHRLDIAIEEGFARKDTAYMSFSTTLERLKKLLLLKKQHLPEKKIPELRKKMQRVQEMMDSYIKELEEKDN